ncbi:MAG: hypothetical protein DI626_01285 [Micavibrio aeruginosavorus]|uniref:Transcriptional regulator-like domain-containing protein n=1 Tax=Micavibrio aeruginosavorus TaxID=349221 RepID=A0A2W5C018_9BACT|nr:MAG: hypothetical protein DI626_01285 [Micavibrio aeruginosavorus]
MSKSSWAELPDATKPDSYSFMAGACGEVWAWEFLRRFPEYHADWDKYGGGKQTTVFIPPMKPEDIGSQKRWISRILEEGGEEPRTLHVDDYAAERWGLKKLAPYDQPYGKPVVFLKPVSMYPMLIRREEDLIPFLEEIGGYDGTPHVNAIVPDKAIFVFDLETSRMDQIRVLKEALDCIYEENRALHSIKRTGFPKKETEYLKRHLRVLDLLRTVPDISCADIAIALGYDETVTGKSAAQQGHRWKEQALAAQRNYRSFLYKPSTTGNGQIEV